ncbi:MAG: hypothetical protein SFV54_03925 [Bryobacteraceae bacterium]|nr:hypothetical protein [Bryobacteraceae bacterium]
MRGWFGTAVQTGLTLAAIAVLLYLLHRTALAMERRGWIYYVKKRASPDAIGNALLTLHQMAKPEMKHVLEAKRERRRGDTPGDGRPDA